MAAKIKKDEIDKLQQLSLEQRHVEYRWLVGRILKDHKCSPKTHMITVDGKIIKKPDWMRNGLPKPEVA